MELAIGVGEFLGVEHGLGAASNELGPAGSEVRSDGVESLNEIIIELYEYFATGHGPYARPYGSGAGGYGSRRLALRSRCARECKPAAPAAWAKGCRHPLPFAPHGHVGEVNGQVLLGEVVRVPVSHSASATPGSRSSNPHLGLGTASSRKEIPQAMFTPEPTPVALRAARSGPPWAIGEIPTGWSRTHWRKPPIHSSDNVDRPGVCPATGRGRNGEQMATTCSITLKLESMGRRVRASGHERPCSSFEDGAAASHGFPHRQRVGLDPRTGES